MCAWQLSSLAICLTFVFALASVPPLHAEEGAVVDGAGFTLYEVESIKGFDQGKVDKDPVCDRTKRPKILEVDPDEAKPGQRITIRGEHFGTEECFQGVAFSVVGSARIEYTFVNETTIEVTVPDVRPGMSFIDVIAGGGNARSKAFLIQAK